MLPVILFFTLSISPAQLSPVGPPPPPPPPAAPRDMVNLDKTPGKAVVRGRVTTAEGKPLRRARVSIRLAESSTPKIASTNVHGRYEIRDLPAGRYLVSVIRSGYLPITYGQRNPGEPGTPVELSDGQVIENVDFALPRTSVITGRVIDELGETVSEAQVVAMQLRYFNGRRQLVPVSSIGMRTDDTGQFRLLNLRPGEYVVMASIRETWPLEDDPTQVVGYAPTYYPSAVNPAEAQRLRVGLGQELSAIDIQLLPGRTSKVSGAAMSSTGVPIASQSIVLTHELRGPTSVSMSNVKSTTTRPDGTFTFTDVPIGEYKIATGPPRGTKGEQGEVVVQVTGGDIEGVTVVTGSGGTIRGSVAREDGLPLGNELSKLVLRVQTFSGDMRTMSSGGDNGRVNPDGTFEFVGAFGSALLSLTALPPAWFIKSIEHDGRELSDAHVPIRHGDTLSGVRILLTDKVTGLSGTIRDARQQPTFAGTVVVFSADPSKWDENGRCVTSARPDRQGRYQVRGLPPGEYLAIALDYVEDGNWNDPEYLEGIRSRAERFTLAEAETKAVDLELKK